MEIGVISDTHGLVRPQVYEAFEGVDLILHAGDVGGLDVIVELEVIAPVWAVAGNNDIDLIDRLKERETLTLKNRNIHLEHIFNDLPEAPDDSGPDASRIVIFGHSHKPFNQRHGDTLYFNPGSAGPRRFKLPVTAGRISLGPNCVTSQILNLE